MRRCLAGVGARVPGVMWPFWGAVLAAAALVVVVGGERRLAAAADAGTDPDGDFLTNAQEAVLGTTSTVTDSDGDGFSDLEELARGTSPLFANQAPIASAPAHVGMTAHGTNDGFVHVVVAVHSAIPNPRDVDIGFGVQVNRRIATFSPAWLATHSTMQVTTSADGLGLVYLIDVAIDASTVLAAGHSTFFATASIPGHGVVSADTVRLLNVGGVVVLVAAPPRPVQNMQNPGGALPGSIYVPLPTDGSGGIPAGWSSGEICFQRSSPVAVNGPVVTQEVVSASCLNGWEGYCPPSCTSTVGTTYSTVDPIGLIGG